MNDHTINSLLGAAAGSMHKALCLNTEMFIPKDEINRMLRQMFDEMSKQYLEDDTSWENAPMSGSYDLYLEKRRKEGSITPYDLVRRGLTVHDFSDGSEFNAHNMRVSADKENSAAVTGQMKTCTMCGKEKPRTKFPRAGGSKCKVCVDRQTRTNRILRRREINEQ